MTAAMIVRAACAGMLLLGVLAACEPQSAGAATASQPYDITTQTRPESLEGYANFYRGLHQVCAAAREMMQLPPPAPLVAFPPGFVTERVTYLHSGNAWLQRREEFFMDVTELTPELGCKSRIGSAMTEELVQGAQVRMTRREADGNVVVEPADTLPPPKQAAAEPYTERRTLRGVAMRCAPVNATLGPAVMQDMCILDTAAGVPLDGRGDVVTVHARSTLLERSGIVLLTEPVNVQLGKPVSQQRLALAGAR